MKLIKTTLQKFDSKLWGYHFPVSASEGQSFVEGNDRRVICQINDRYTVRSALMPAGGAFFILANKSLIQQLGLSEGEEVTLRLEKDTSEYGMDIPETLRTLLEQDDDGRKYFDALTPGRQRSLIYIVAKVKSMDSQLNKALAIIDHLKSVSGQLDFKLLNQQIKLYNQRSKLK